MRLFHIISVLGSLAFAQAYTADCEGSRAYTLTSDQEQILWKMRDDMCSNSQCGYQQECVLSRNLYDNVGFTMIRVNPPPLGGGKGFAHCWDGTAAIINQCAIAQGTRNAFLTIGNEEYELGYLTGAG